MKEIKFRAWYAGKMNYNLPAIRFYLGNVNRVEINHDDDDFTIPGDTWFDLPKDDGVLMQYTVLKDKNGKEIYEGDILQDGNYKGVCQYVKDKCAFGINRNVFGTGGYGHLNSEMEIIGNIYENPELTNDLNTGGLSE